MSTKAEIDVRGMSDAELSRFVQAAQAEVVARERKRKEDAIAKIRALAGEAGLAVSIEGARGRPGGKAARAPGKKAPRAAKAVATP